MNKWKIVINENGDVSKSNIFLNGVDINCIAFKYDVDANSPTQYLTLQFAIAKGLNEVEFETDKTIEPDQVIVAKSK